LAAVDKPILGADFLSHFRLLVDPFNKQVLFAASLKPVSKSIDLKHSPFYFSLKPGK
jgi:hypothetical protein